MVRIAQFGIALGALGLVLIFMGLFPGVTGLSPAAGIGIVQLFVALVGFALLNIGALVYVKTSFYYGVPETLAQEIGVRLSLTGIVLAPLLGLADVLGFGSHSLGGTDSFFGTLQAVGMVGCFFISSIGVLIYAMTGKLPDD